MAGNAMDHAQTRGIVPLAASGLTTQNGRVSVADLEQALLARFPAADAEDWDRTGLIVGDPSRPIEAVAVALDATPEAVIASHSIGANVLVTHHPVFLEPPSVISPQIPHATPAGASVFHAVDLGVAVMSFHTALDASPKGNTVLPRMLNLEIGGVMDQHCSDSAKGYGRICSARDADGVLSLGELGARCLSVFGRRPRIWGDKNRKMNTVVVATGSAGNLAEACVRAHADCLICGEIRYHVALDSLQSGLCVIELGHDVSELPLAAALASEIAECGIPSELIHVLDQDRYWDTPTATRI